MSVKHSQSDFIKQVENAYPNSFEVLGEYINKNKKVKVKHFKCNREFDVYPYDFVNKRYSECSFCKKQYELELKLKELISKKFNNEFTFNLGEALKTKDFVEFTHSLCGNSFNTSHSVLKNSNGCFICTGHIFTIGNIQKRIDDMTSKDEFEIMNKDIKTITSYVNIHHRKCNRSFDTYLPYFVYQKPHCHHCSKEKNRVIKMKSNDVFLGEFKSIYGKSYSVLTEYNGAHEKVKVKHNDCGNEFHIKPNTALSLTFSCEICKQSNPESIIYNELKSNNVDFKIQYKFKDCTGDRNRRLPFDFAIFEDDKLKCLIEYDGQHHFSEKIYGSKSYNSIIKNDNIKNEYCQNNYIKLYRIKYTELKNLRSIIRDIIAS